MKTRIIAALGAVGLVSVLAGGTGWATDAVYSVNYAGFVQVTIDSKEWALMTNPFDAFPGEDVSFTTAVGEQIGTGTAFRWDGAGQSWLQSIKLPGFWLGDDPNATKRGTGFWLYNGDAAPAVVMIAGQVPADATTGVAVGAPSALIANPWPANFDPTADAVLGAAPIGTSIYQWDGAAQAWTSTVNIGLWLPSPFAIPAGSGFWYLRPQGSGAFTWTSAKPYAEP